MIALVLWTAQRASDSLTSTTAPIPARSGAEVGHKPTGVTFVVAATRADAMTRAASRGDGTRLASGGRRDQPPSRNHECLAGTIKELARGVTERRAEAGTNARTMATTLGVALLIDPDADTRAMYAVALEKHGFVVLEADTGEEALKQATTTMPSVVVMDWRLAGPVTGEGLRHHFRTLGVPIVVLTGLDLDEVYLWTRREGCAALLPKPVAADTVAAVVSCVSGARRAGTA